MIPIELYHKKTLKLPQILIDAYIDKLESMGKIEESKKNMDGEIGGDQAEEAINHFVGRFPNGAVRSQYVVINPEGELADISHQLATVFSDKDLKILYLPCGSGAGLLGLITTFIVLRKYKYHPTLPLNIHIIGADYSPKALEIFDHMLQPMIGECLKVGINLSYTTRLWDATKDFETMSLLHNFFGQNADEYFVFFSNISGASGSNTLFDDSFRTVINYVSTLPKNSTLLWIEPGGFSKAERLFKKIAKIFEPLIELWNSLVESKNDITNIPNTSYEWIHPTSGKNLGGKISGLRLIIDGKNND